jgi:hypothetical protein
MKQFHEKLAQPAGFRYQTATFDLFRLFFAICFLAIHFAALFDFFDFVAFWYRALLHRITQSVRCRDRDRFNNVVDRIDQLLDYVFIRVAHGAPSKFPIGMPASFAGDERHSEFKRIPSILGYGQQ